MATSDPKTLLVVLPTWVGDYVMATPALRAIRNRFDAARIVHLVEPNLVGLAKGGDLADVLMPWPAARAGRPWSRVFRRLVGELREFRFDLAVLLANSFRAALVAWLAGAKRRAGYGRDGRSWLLTESVAPRFKPRPRQTVRIGGGDETSPAEVIAGYDWQRLARIPDRSASRFLPVPLVDYYAELVESVGCASPPTRFELSSCAAAEAAVEARLRELGLANRHPLVVVSPGAKFGVAKCWPADRFAAACDRLTRDAGAAVLITCGPGEEAIAKSIGAMMSGPGHVLVDPLLTLDELKSLIRRADLLLCNDAGPRHIAKAFLVPVATVFGPTHPLWTATRHELERIVRVDIDCGPCQQRVCPLGHHRCMTAVDVETVVNACQELLATAAHAAGSGLSK